jgi:hypothetical protein
MPARPSKRTHQQKVWPHPELKVCGFTNRRLLLTNIKEQSFVVLGRAAVGCKHHAVFAPERTLQLLQQLLYDKHRGHDEAASHT